MENSNSQAKLFAPSLFTDQIDSYQAGLIKRSVEPLLQVWQRYPEQCTQLYNELLHRFTLAHQLYDAVIPNHKQEPLITHYILDALTTTDYTISLSVSKTIYNQIFDDVIKSVNDVCDSDDDPQAVLAAREFKANLRSCYRIFFGYAPELHSVTNPDKKLKDNTNPDTEPVCEFTSHSIMWVLDKINSNEFYYYPEDSKEPVYVTDEYANETLQSSLTVYQLTESPLFSHQILWRRLIDAEYIIGSVFSEVFSQLPTDLYESK